MPNASNMPPPAKSPSTLMGGVGPVDAQHLGAHVGEEHPAEGPGPEPDDLHGAQPLERTRHENTF